MLNAIVDFAQWGASHVVPAPSLAHRVEQAVIDEPAEVSCRGALLDSASADVRGTSDPQSAARVEQRVCGTLRQGVFTDDGIQLLPDPLSLIEAPGYGLRLHMVGVQVELQP